MVKVNLLPRESREKTNLQRDLTIFILILIVSIGVYVIYLFYKNNEVKRVTQEVTSIEKQVAELKEKYKEIDRLKEIDKDLSSRIEIVKNLIAEQKGPAPVFDALVSLLPEHIWLNNLSLNSNKISFQGYAFSNNVIADFMKSLDASPYFENTGLGETIQETQGSVKIHKFTLNCTITIPKEEAGKR
ncbi:MAG: PilN domain-containing protein [bacterium]